MTFVERLIEPKKQIPDDRKRFSNRALAGLIVPVVLQSFLNSIVGLADTAMVSHAGDGCVSGVALVDTLSHVIYLIFVALASGGAIIASQYVGRKDREHSDEAAGQLVMMITAISIVFAVPVFIFSGNIIDIIYTDIDETVRAACVEYLHVTCLSFIAMALINAFSALLRAMGKTKTILYASLAMNAVNLFGNTIGVFILRAGVDGVAYPTLISRFVCAIILAFSVCREGEITVRAKYVFAFRRKMIKRILVIAIPSGIESVIFQVAKIYVVKFITLSGTVHTDAWGIGCGYAGMQAIFAEAVGTAFITITGQYMGAGDTDGAQYYMKKLLRICYVVGFAINAVLAALAPFVIKLYNTTSETVPLILGIIYIHNVFYYLFGPLAFALSNGLQATGDVRYTLVSVIICTLIIRTATSYVLSVVCGFGAVGAQMAMAIDWIVKAGFIYIRFKTGKWKEIKVI